MMELFFEYGLIGLFLASFLAATVIPLSSEAIFAYMIAIEFNLYLVIFIATFGNWLGGVTSFYLGRIGKWEWIEKYFRVDRIKVEKKKQWLQKYGSPVALLCWLPLIGDVIAVGLGFVRVNTFWVITFMLIGKAIRYIVIAYLVLIVI